MVSALREALGNIGARSRDIVAVLPDAAVRVVLLDFETLPDKHDEAESVIRFRLRKSLPFDVDKAKVSYQAQTANGATRVVAAVALNSIVEDYESAFRDAGFAPGVVMPSMLAALGGASADRATLVVKVDARTTSIAILDQGHLLLFRTLENARGVTISGEQLAEDVYPSVVFFQRHLQHQHRRDFCCWHFGPHRCGSRPAFADGRRSEGTGSRISTGPGRGVNP